MATAIADAAAARRDYLDETGGRYVHVIADSALRTSGDVAKAIACGADAVALGAPLAAAQTAGGKGMYWPSTAAHPKAPRGQVRYISARGIELGAGAVRAYPESVGRRKLGGWLAPLDGQVRLHGFEEFPEG